jgi:hypothetical protein
MALGFPWGWTSAANARILEPETGHAPAAFPCLLRVTGGGFVALE